MHSAQAKRRAARRRSILPGSGANLIEKSGFQIHWFFIGIRKSDKMPRRELTFEKQHRASARAKVRKAMMKRLLQNVHATEARASFSEKRCTAPRREPHFSHGPKSDPKRETPKVAPRTGEKPILSKRSTPRWRDVAEAPKCVPCYDETQRGAFAAQTRPKSGACMSAEWCRWL